MEDLLISTPNTQADESWESDESESRRDDPLHRMAQSGPVAAAKSPAMVRIDREVAAVAPLRSTVLITGETGTGKGVIARRIHELSDRNDRPFVHVDCAALAASLIESELFGHERGAFTSAADRRIGRFEAAGNGTIFLDEIGELPLGLQSKLLHVLQERSFVRIGGNRSLPMSARVIAATNRDLASDVRQGKFREDLLYRVDVFRFHLPPLRERTEDIPNLIERGFAKIAGELQISPPSLPEGILQRLLHHQWPGNVRELMNVLERLVIRHGAQLLDGFSLDELLSPKPQLANPLPSFDAAPLPAAGSEAERAVLERVLSESGGNVARAARRIGIARSTLRYRLALHNLKYLIPTD